jgi:hypothetical protein
MNIKTRQVSYTLAIAPPTPNQPSSELQLEAYLSLAYVCNFSENEKATRYILSVNATLTPQ